MRISLRHRGTTMIAAGLGALTLTAGVPALAAARPAASHPAASHQAASHQAASHQTASRQTASRQTASRQAASRPTAARGDVLVNCAGRARVRPRSYVLACADGNDYLAGVRWVSWSGGTAFGRGTEHVNDCVPDCAEGHFHAYPVLITAWRAVPRPRHAGQRYFSRLTEIYTGKRPAYYRGPGKKYYPQTVTWHLTGTVGGPRQ